MFNARNYNKGIIDRVNVFIGDRVLEVGSGLGNITELLVKNRFVRSLEIRKDYVKKVNNRFKNYKNFKAIAGDIIDTKVINLKKYNFDTIVCINVLEHIKDDVKALKNMFLLVKNKGYIILLVPAIKILYGSMDKADLHYRRYTKSDLQTKFKNSGFKIEKIFYINSLGIFGWFVNGRILKRNVLPEKQLKFYDKVIPLVFFLEKTVGPPIGQSLVIIGKKE